MACGRSQLARPASLQITSLLVRILIWRRNPTVAIASSPVELSLRYRCGVLIPASHGFPDHVENVLSGADETFAHAELTFCDASTLWQRIRSDHPFVLESGVFWEPDCQDVPIGSVHDINAPSSPILTYPIALGDQVTGRGKRFFPCRLKVGVRVSFGILNDAALGPHVEVEQSRFGLGSSRRIQKLCRLPMRASMR
jgi:hypothetical protein